jgi:hypothetical protein
MSSEDTNKTPLKSNPARYRPLLCGIQISNKGEYIASTGNKTSIGAPPIGTLGCFGHLKSDGSPALLSNYHVIFNGMLDATLDLARTKNMHQPIEDNCCCCCCASDNIVGQIWDGRYGQKGVDKKLDAAIAKISAEYFKEAEGVMNVIRGFGPNATDAPITGVAEKKQVLSEKGNNIWSAVSLHEKVYKVGIRTGYTEGIVTGLEATSTPKNGEDDKLSYIYQIEIKSAKNGVEFADEGDSGSVILNEQLQVVGLLMSSGELAVHKVGEKIVNGVKIPVNEIYDLTYANHIHEVMDQLAIDIFPSPIAHITQNVPAAGTAAPFTASFSGNGSQANSTQITKYKWEIFSQDDDEAVATYTGKDVQHVFSQAGTYTIQLTVVNERRLCHIAREVVKITGGASLVQEASQTASTGTARTRQPTELFETVMQGLQTSREGRIMLRAIKRHQQEVIDLINHNRKVLVAWRRMYGPAAVAHLIRMAMIPGAAIPKEIKGVPLQTILINTSLLLEENGSSSLATAIRKYRLGIINAFDRFTTFDELYTFLRIPLMRS